jgi:photosystem II stability/assembly factor-like uncharacterized protein
VSCMLRVIRSLRQCFSGPGEYKLSGPAFFLAVFVLVLGPGLARAQRWERLGPPGGMVISLAEASDGAVYLGAPDGHVFASNDRGEHWELRGRAGDGLDGVVQRIVPDARNRSRVLAAVWFRDSRNGGVFESADGARSWKLVGLKDEAVRALEQSTSDPRAWVAGTRSGVFRSVDDARSWQRITRVDDPELQNVDSLAVDPRDAQTIYVGTYHLPWKTTDGGKTWNLISAGMIDDSDVMSLRIDARDPRRIFSSACSGIYRSEDGGASWTKLQGIPYSSRRTQQIVQDPEEPRTLYAATTEGLWMTADYGETWKRITSRDTDAAGVVLLAGKGGQRILAGMTAQGILRSDDRGNSFVSSNNGFSHRVITAAGADRADRGRLLVRAEGHGGKLIESSDGGRSWAESEGAAPPKSVERIFPSSTGWWVAYAGGGLARFDGKLRTWRALGFREIVPLRRGKQSSRRLPVSRIVNPQVRSVLEEGDRTIAATDNGLWELAQGGKEFRRANAKNLPVSVSYLAAGAGSLLAIAGGELWRRDSKSDWKHLAAPQGGDGLLWTKQSPFAQDQVVVGTERGVYVGEADGRWRLVSSGLPAIASGPPAFSGTSCLMGMTNGGLYLSSDGMKTWKRIDSDAERSRVGAIFSLGDGRFLVSSVQEGILLRFEPQRSER